MLKPTFRILLLAIAASLISACKHSDDPTPAIRPGTESSSSTDSGSTTTDDGVPIHDMSQALNDSNSRYESDDLSLYYNDGGIIFEHDNANRLRIINLTTDKQILFDPDAQQLQIDGITIELSYCALAKSENGTSWYNLTRTSDQAQIIIVD